MTRDQLYNHLRHPANLSVETLPEIKALLEAYPYCGSCMFLYLYNLAAVGDVRYPSELRRLGPLLPCRKKLYKSVIAYLKPNAPIIDDETAQDGGDLHKDPFALIEDFLDEMQASGADLPNELSYPGGSVVAADYFSTSRRATNGEQSASPATEGFINVENEKTKIPKGFSLSPLKPEENRSTKERASEPYDGISPIVAPSSDLEQDNDLEEGLFTETLAKIYIKQKRYDKALRIIRSLSLNYPEKSTYFADQIRYLEKLIDNEKQI